MTYGSMPPRCVQKPWPTRCGRASATTFGALASRGMSRVATNDLHTRERPDVAQHSVRMLRSPHKPLSRRRHLCRICRGHDENVCLPREGTSSHLRLWHWPGILNRWNERTPRRGKISTAVDLLKLVPRWHRFPLGRRAIRSRQPSEFHGLRWRRRRRLLRRLSENLRNSRSCAIRWIALATFTGRSSNSRSASRAETIKADPPPLPIAIVMRSRILFRLSRRAQCLPHFFHRHFARRLWKLLLETTRGGLHNEIEFLL